MVVVGGALLLHLAPGFTFPPTELFRSMQAVYPEAKQIKNCLSGLCLFPTSSTPYPGLFASREQLPKQTIRQSFPVTPTCPVVRGNPLCLWEELTFGGLIAAVTLPLP